MQKGVLSKINNRMVNSVDPDGMAHYEPSHLDLHCFQRYSCWSAGLNGLNIREILDLPFLHSKTLTYIVLLVRVDFIT